MCRAWSFVSGARASWRASAPPNLSSNPVEKARGEQGLAAVRRCSPMQIAAEFTPFYDDWRVTELDMKEDMP